MAYTFRSGPRDPETGRSSTVISSSNLIRDPNTGRAAQADRSGRVTGITNREYSAIRGVGDFAPPPPGAMTRDEYMAATGRTVTDPYGSTKGGIGRGLESLDKALGGSGLDYSGIQSLAQRNAVIDHAYKKYLNPMNKQGQLRQFRPNEIALLTDPATGARFPARAKAVPRDLGFASILPGAGIAQFLMGPKTELVPMEGSFDNAPAPVTDAQRQDLYGGLKIKTSTLPRQDNGIFNLPFSLNNLQKIPETGIGGFIEQGKNGFQIGPGKLKPEFNVNDKSFGLTYKIPIAANPNFSLPPNPELETEAEYKARKDKLINQAMIDKYLEGQSDVGVYTPPRPPVTYQEGMTLLPDLRESQQQQYGGFADPLVGGTLSDMLNRQRQEQRLNNKPLPNSYSPRRIAREALLSGRRFQQI